VAEPFVAIVKLVSNESLIARVDPDEVGETIRLQKPMEAIINPVSGDVGLLDYLLLCQEEEITLPAEKVVFIGTAKPELGGSYEEKFWGKKRIVKPTKRIVLPD